MSTLVKTTTFVDGPGHFILSAEVNQNFDEIITFLNNLVVHTDGSKVFTGIPTGPAADPTSDNQFARKAYVDAQTAGTGSAVAAETAARIAAVGGEAAARVAADNVEVVARTAAIAVASAALSAHYAGNRQTVTSDGNGDFTIFYGKAMASTPGVSVSAGQASNINYAVTFADTNGFICRMFNPATAAALPSRTEIVSWTAVCN